MPPWPASPATPLPSSPAADPGPARDDLEKTFGIRITALRTIAANRMLDLRYVVADPVKAEPMLSKNARVKLIHESTKEACAVVSTRLGPMRQTTMKPEAGRMYFILFKVPATGVKSGEMARIQLEGMESRPIPIEIGSATPGRPEKPGAGKAEAKPYTAS